MEGLISNLVREFESGKMSRRQLIQSVAMAAAVYGAGAEAAEAAPAPATLGFSTISVNHISYSCSGADYTKARDFYVKLLAMDYPDDMDTGGEACLAFGPLESQSFLLPRGGGRDPNAPPAAPRGGGAGGGGFARGASGATGATAAFARGAGGGGGRGADPCGDGSGAANAGFAVAPAAAGGGGRGQRQPVTAVIDQIGITVANWDKSKVEAALKKHGLDPKPDGESFHVVDPFGMDLQICGPKVTAY